MSDNMNQRGPADRSRINVHESWEVKHWTQALGCSEEQLRKAVEAVGVSAEAVRSYLSSKP